MNWSEGLRQKAAELFEKGLGYKAVSSELGVNRETVRDWSYTWRALGTDEFLKSHIGERIEYAPEIKVAVAQDRIAGMGVVEVMAKYHIPLEPGCPFLSTYPPVIPDQEGGMKF